MFEDCEFPNPDNPSQVQLLEERIAAVKNRIRSVEIPEHMPEITLFDPYSHHEEYNAQDSSSNPLPPASSSSGSLLCFPTAASTLQYVQEPPPDERCHMLDLIFSYNHQTSFFLDLNRFCQSMILPSPLGDHNRPSPALITATYLWGCCLSPTSSKAREQALLHNALYYLSRDLSSSHPRRIIHSIQAEVLLSFHYLKDSKILEGRHHAEVALSLALGSGLHRIRSSRPLSAPPTSNSNLLPTPVDMIEEGERIDAFWAVVNLNNCWSAIQDSHLVFSHLQPELVDTPWPLDSYKQESDHLPRESFSSLQRFLNGSSMVGISDKALRTKATILLARAISLNRGNNGSLPRSDDITCLDSLIETLKDESPLPGPDRLDLSPLSTSVKERKVLTQMLAHAATIRLHLPLTLSRPDSYHKCIQAVQAIVFLTTDTIKEDSNGVHADPALGIVWVCAVEGFVKSFVSGGVTVEERSALFTPLETITSQLEKFSETSRLFEYLRERVEELCNSRKFPSSPDRNGGRTVMCI